MDKIQKSVIFFILLAVNVTLINSCGDKTCIDAPDVSKVSLAVSIERLDKKLYKIPTKEELAELLDSHPTFAESFLHISEYPMPEIIVERYHDLLNASDIDSLFYEVEKTFGDMEDIRLQFEDAFRHLKYYYPDFKAPRIQTVVTGEHLKNFRQVKLRYPNTIIGDFDDAITVFGEDLHFYVLFFSVWIGVFEAV